MEVLNSMKLIVSLDNLKEFNPSLRDFQQRVPLSFFQMILKTDIGLSFSPSDNYSFKRININLFQKIQKNHILISHKNFFNIKNENKYFEKDTKYQNKMKFHNSIEKNCKNEICLSQIREIFRNIFFQVGLNQLFGNNRNQKKIIKNLYNFLLTARTETFSLLQLLRKLNVCKIIDLFLCFK